MVSPLGILEELSRRGFRYTVWAPGCGLARFHQGTWIRSRISLSASPRAHQAERYNRTPNDLINLACTNGMHHWTKQSVGANVEASLERHRAPWERWDICMLCVPAQSSVSGPRNSST
jgi:hypothetical protein